MPSPFVSFLTQHIDALRGILLSRDSYVRSVLPEPWIRGITSSREMARENFRALYALLTLEIWHRLFIRDKVYTRPELSTVDLFKIPGRALAA